MCDLPNYTTSVIPLKPLENFIPFKAPKGKLLYGFHRVRVFDPSQNPRQYFDNSDYVTQTRPLTNTVHKTRKEDLIGTLYDIPYYYSEKISDAVIVQPLDTSVGVIPEVDMNDEEREFVALRETAIQNGLRMIQNLKLLPHQRDEMRKELYARVMNAHTPLELDYYDPETQKLVENRMRSGRAAVGSTGGGPIVPIVVEPTRGRSRRPRSVPSYSSSDEKEYEKKIETAVNKLKTTKVYTTLRSSKDLTDDKLSAIAEFVFSLENSHKKALKSVKASETSFRSTDILSQMLEPLNKAINNKYREKSPNRLSIKDLIIMIQSLI